MPRAMDMRRAVGVVMARLPRRISPSDRLVSLRHDPLRSVVVSDLDVVCSAVGPDEADPVLIVEPDRVLPRSVARELGSRGITANPVAAGRSGPRNRSLTEIPSERHPCSLLDGTNFVDRIHVTVVSVH